MGSNAIALTPHYGRTGGLGNSAKSAENQRMDAVRAIEASVPRLRGVLHAYACPVVLVLGVLGAQAAATGRGALAILVMATGYAAIFATSGAYHRLPWSPTMRRRARQADHCMIFIGMAMTYTALWIGVLDGTLADIMLVYCWVGAIFGVLAKLRFIDARPSQHSIAYIVFGLGAMVMAPALVSAMGAVGGILFFTGAAAIAAGSVAFVAGRPNPFPGLVGHHEVFHLATVLGASLHLAALSGYVLR